MTPSWEQGRAEIDALLSRRDLDRVAASPQHAERLLLQSRRHLGSAAVLRADDPDLAFSAAYDAARKALTAVLAAQGLRPTARGGHVVLLDAALAQLDPPLGGTIKPFDWMRRRRNSAEYPSPDSPAVTPDEVDEGIVYAEKLVELAEKLASRLPSYGN